jgi:hypothetical protein
VQAEKSNDTNDKSEESVLETAKARFKLAAEAEDKVRREALDDLRFSAGEQWPEDVKAQRAADKRPCLTINRLPQSIRQVTNDQRQNRPSIKVYPVDDQADIETAKILQGLVRHIENNSNADVAYDTAFDGAVRKSFGYFRIVTDYCDPMSFDQEIKIKRIRNAFTVYFDPSSQEPDGSDANWAFVVERMSKDEYKSRYKDSELASMEDWKSIGDSDALWTQENECIVVEYFYKSFKEVTLLQLTDGQVIVKEELTDEMSQQLALEGLSVANERKSVMPAIKWAKINGEEILDETDWPGQWIPIIPVIGDELDVDGERVLESLIRHAKDPQRQYNYFASSETEAIALAPRVPFIGAEGQFEGHENKWSQANVRNFAFLEYKAKTIAGQLAPAPQRQVFEAPVQAITQARMQAAEDLKSTTGIFDASLGAQSNEKSGIAIQRRNLQAQTSNFHFIDNLSRSIRHAGRIIVDLIPKIYDAPRTQRIIGDEGDQQIVRINQIFEKNGQEVIYDLSKGKYDVIVDTGPSFATKRQEARESMVDLARSIPQIGQFAPDLLMKVMDFPMSQELAERMKKSLPPGIAEDKDDKKQAIPPEAQQQMQQMDQMIQQLTEQLKARTEQAEAKTLELESKERIEFAKLETHAAIELAKLESKEALTSLQAQIAELDRRQQLLGINQPIENQSFEAPAADSQGFEAGMNEPQEQQPGADSQQGFEPGVYE